MQPPRRNQLLAGLCVGALAAFVVVGCKSVPTGSQQPALHQQPTAPTQDARTAGSAAADPYAQPGAQEIARLMARLDALETDNTQLKQQLSAQYLESLELRRQQIEAQKQLAEQKASPRPVPNGAGNGSSSTANAGDTAGGSSAATGVDGLSRHELLDALMAKIVAGDDPARTKALMAAALSVASPGHELDPALLDKLDPRTREQVARFHQVLAVAYDELAGDPRKRMTRSEMIAQIDAVFGPQPLSIGELELCRRVDSYGVYEPFGARRFLAGRKNRVLIYVELENFHHEPTEDGKYEVRLEQQVELFDATGETTVWRQGPVELKDVSRNKRRDFFIVYPVDLPARLTLGTYRLKVRIADKHTGSICEQTLHDIQVVADQALVGGD